MEKKMNILIMFGALAMSVGWGLLIAWVGCTELFELMAYMRESEVHKPLKGMRSEGAHHRGFSA
jgi:hypothetical protein